MQSEIETRAERELRTNVRVYYVTKALMGALGLGTPRLFSMYEEAGLSQAMLNMVQTWFTAVWLIAELPCGVFSDRFGHRRSVTAGLSTVSVGALVYGMASGLYGFMLADALIGIGIAFISGADRGLVYNQLRRLGREASDGRKITENGYLCAMLSFTVANFCSQYIVNGYGLQAPYIVASGVILLSALASLFSKEAPMERASKTRRGWLPKEALSGILRSLSEVFTVIFRHSDARWVVLVPALILGTMRPMVWFLERLVEAQGSGREMSSWLFAAVNLSALCGIWISKRLSHVTLSSSGVAMLCLNSLLLLGAGGITHPIVLLFPMLLQGVRAFVTVAGEHEIQLHVPDTLRATVHSAQQSAMLVIYLCILLRAGMVAEGAGGERSGFLFLGGVALIGAIALAPLRPSRKV